MSEFQESHNSIPSAPACRVCSSETHLKQTDRPTARHLYVFRCGKCEVEHPVVRPEQK